MKTAFDDEGRFIAAHYGRLAVVCVYFPKGSGKDRDNSRVAYKMDFYRAVFDRIEVLRKRGPVYVVGDYNTAHEEIDLGAAQDKQKSQWVSTYRA